MGIRLNKLAVKNLGPQQNINFDFSDVNLIYGLNESGKTFIVEFLISSLFKNNEFPGMRNIPDTSGTLYLSGLAQGIDNRFTPKRRSKKLDDILINVNGDLPKDISKLLVVRGGELAFESSESGVSETILKEYLSNEATLDKILGKITATVQSGTFTNGVIEGNFRGEIKQRGNLAENLKNISQLIEKVNEEYSLGNVRLLRNHIERIDEELQVLRNQRRKMAYALYQEAISSKEIISEKEHNLRRIHAKIFETWELLNEEKTKFEAAKKKIVSEISNEINYYQSNADVTQLEIGKIVSAVKSLKDKYQEELSEYNKGKIDELGQEIHTFFSILQRQEEIQKKIKGLPIDEEKSLWLTNAIEEYQTCVGSNAEPGAGDQKNSWLFVIISGVVALSAILILALSQDLGVLKIVSFVSSTILFLTGLLNALKFNRTIKSMTERLKLGNATDEIDSIRSHFSELYDMHENKIDLAVMKVQREKNHKDELALSEYLNQMEKLKTESSDLEEKIRLTYYSWTSRIIEQSNWDQELVTLRARLTSLQEKQMVVAAYLDNLNFQDAVSIDSGTYSDKSFEELCDLISEAQEANGAIESNMRAREEFLQRVEFSKDSDYLKSESPKPISVWNNQWKELDEELEKINKSITEIDLYFERIETADFSDEEQNPDYAEMTFKELKKKADQISRDCEEIKDSIHEIDLELAALAIQESEYMEPDICENVDFNKDELNSKVKEKEGLEIELSDEQKKLDELKSQVAGYLSTNSSSPWDDLLDQLNHRLNEIEKEYKTLTAKIIGGICVTNVLKELRQDERQNLRQSLNTPSVVKSLSNLTGGYDKYVLEADGQLSVKNDYETFPLREISTGTREQVLLSLRLGFASNLFKDEPLFLILDDAFQHSDWKRRENLVNHMFQLANGGWQIVYFTMDDHIKGLFDKTSTVFPVGYKSIELNI